MFFSIITICKNDKDRLFKTLNSVYEQDFGDYEHIIEDGSSVDGTKEMVETYCSERERHSLVLYIEKDNGIYDAMNRAIQKAHGDFICFLNAGDCFLNRTTLSEVHRGIEENSSGEIFYGGAVMVFPNGTENSQVTPLNEDILCHKDTYESVNMSFIHQAIFARSCVFDSCKFDCTFSLRAELDWYYQCFRAGFRFSKLHFPVCTYELGGVSEKSSSTRNSITETVDILKKYGYSPERYLNNLQNTHLTKGVYKYIYNEWLSLKMAGRSMESHLLEKGINRIILYGYGELGCHVIRELNDSSVNIYAIVERDERYPYTNIPIMKPTELTGKEPVDAMMVTAIMHFDEIYEVYKEVVPYPIISLEKLLEDMWK